MRRVIAAARKRIAGGIRWPFDRATDGWRALDDRERILLPGLVLLAGGLAMVAVPLALIIPGAILVAISLGFHLARGGKA